MSRHTGFRLPRVCLPRRGIELEKWAVVACDQHTAEPAYWAQVQRLVGDAPSTLQLIFPEAYLGAGDEQARVERIQRAMRDYLADGLLDERECAVYVERTVGGRTRRGLLLELDLEHYDYSAASTSLIRPTEGTIIARLAPRIAVRRDAELELPHVLVLIDDPERTVIEPIAAARGALQPLYETDLMLGGGHVAGFAVDEARAERALQALDALARPDVFAHRYGVQPAAPVMLFAVGDGNHSLATAKSIWAAAKHELGMDHPCRWALVEVENIHDSALAFEPIHRLLLGVSADVRAALAEAFGRRLTSRDLASAEAMRDVVRGATGAGHCFGLVGPGERFSVIEVADPPSSLAVGTLQPFIDRLIEQGGAADVDYVHGDEALERLATRPGHIGFHLGTVAKSALLRRVVREGPLPRKTFSMGEAHEKRYYIEARRIKPQV